MNYVCPLCKEPVWLRTSFSGWELEKVDEVTGETYKLIEAEREEIFDMMYECSSSKCGWLDGESYFDVQEDEEDGNK